MFLGSLSLTNHIPIHLSFSTTADPAQVVRKMTGADLKKGWEEGCGGKFKFLKGIKLRH
jgi:hypothetical protein